MKTKNKFLSCVFTLLFTSSLIGFASPAAAADYTIDCAAPGAPFVDTDPGASYDGYLDISFNSPQPVTVTVAVINCDRWQTRRDGGSGTADFTLALVANSFGSVRGFNVPDNSDSSSYGDPSFQISFRNGFVPNPDSTLIGTVDTSLDLTKTLDLNNSAGWARTVIDPETLQPARAGQLASNSNCVLGTSNAKRFYQTQSLNVVKGGSYTFRIVKTNGDIVSDPFLVLYSTLNTANLDSGLVGCADDYTPSGDAGAENTFISSGTAFNPFYSYLKVDLTPGNYTALFTTFSGFDTFVGDQTAKLELWGPDCGIDVPVCVAARVAAEQAAATAAQAEAARVAAANLAAAELAARTIGLKKKFAIKPLAKRVGVPIVSPKAKVTFKVAKSSKKVCTKSGSKLKTLKAGNCVVTFTVQEPKPKKGKKPKATKTVKTFIVQ